jgi:hypothetical protein
MTILHNPYILAVAVGLLIHLLKKYVFTPGWNVKRFLSEGWPYVVDSVILCTMFAIFGPGIVEWGVIQLGLPDHAALAMRAAPGVFGTLMGLTGGSIAYDIPMVGPILKKAIGKKEDPEPPAV